MTIFIKKLTSSFLMKIEAIERGEKMNGMLQ